MELLLWVFMDLFSLKDIHDYSTAIKWQIKNHKRWSQSRDQEGVSSASDPVLSNF